MRATITVFCMFICMYDVSYVEIEFKTSFKTWQIHKLVKNRQKTHTIYRYFLHKTNKKIQRRPGVKCFVHLRVRLFLHKINKNAS